MTRWEPALLWVALGCQGAGDPLHGARPAPRAARRPPAESRPQVMAAVAPPQETPPPPEPPPESAPESAPDAPSEPPADPTDEQRGHNEAAYEGDYLRQKERLVREELGKWVAIAGGRLLPADARGRLAPAPTFEACLLAAEAADPDSLHRFLFRIGEEGDVVYSDASTRPRNVIGSGLKGALGIAAAFDARAGELRWTRGAKSRTFKLEREQIELLLRDPAGRQSMGVRLADSTAFSGFVLLESTPADLLDAELFEIPGRALLRTGGDPPVVVLRRARVRVVVRELDLDELVPVAAWPR